MSEYYENHKLEGVEHLRRIFPDGEANELNWCIFSTSGVHGLYTTLDMLENKCPREKHETISITILVIMPRVVSMLWGHIEIKKEDIPYLRKLSNSSLEHIANSQKGNL